MSLSVYLKTEKTFKKKYESGIFIRENGQTKEISEEEFKKRFPNKIPTKLKLDEVETNYVYDNNITHNLGKMAAAAGVYYALWRPEEKDFKIAKDIIPVLEHGLTQLRSDPDFFKRFNPENGWGTYEGLCDFVSEYLEACRENPLAEIVVSR